MVSAASVSFLVSSINWSRFWRLATPFATSSAYVSKNFVPRNQSHPKKTITTPDTALVPITIQTIVFHVREIAVSTIQRHPTVDRERRGRYRRTTGRSDKLGAEFNQCV